MFASNSRYIVHHELREAQKEFDVEIVIQRALEKFPGKMPRIISGNGSQFTARDFKQFVRMVGITHVRTSPCNPQSNGKLERWHGSLKQECIRPACPATIEEARKRVANYMDQYNTVRQSLDHNDLDSDGRKGSAEVQPERRSGGQRRKDEGGRSSTAHLPSNSTNQPSDLAFCDKPSWHDPTNAIRQDVITAFC
ncbi:MAG: transposase [Planctomyces sp.]|nr:transposase [Planctomyces sp.]